MMPVFRNPTVWKNPGTMPSMIEKKIRRLIPLPMPRSVICSPTHMMKMAPVVSVSTVSMRKLHTDSIDTALRDSMNTAKPYACPAPSATVR